MGRKTNKKNTSKNQGGKQTDAASLAGRILQFLDAN